MLAKFQEKDIAIIFGNPFLNLTRALPKMPLKS